jgi:hypothetical protein
VAQYNTQEATYKTWNVKDVDNLCYEINEKRNKLDEMTEPQSGK